MCLLVISNYFEKLDPSRLLCVSRRVNELINGARVDGRPLAFLQSQNGASFDSVGIRIGRYEPIFTTCDRGEMMPSGLIDFIVRHAANQVHLAGVAALSQFEQLGHALHRSGYTAVIEAETTFLAGSARSGDASGVGSLHQFKENDAFTGSPLIWSASIKNQSTRWPNA